LEGKTWPSVTHYLESKRVQGKRVEKVRKSSTPWLASKKDNSFIKCYRENGSIRGKVSENNISKELTSKAIKAKFDQNPKLIDRLLKTQSFHSDEPFVTEILTELKKDYLYEIHKEKDIENSIISEQERKLILYVINISERVMEMENCNKIELGMVEDSIYNILGSSFNEFDTYRKETSGINNFSNLCKLDEKVNQVTKNRNFSMMISYLIKFIRERDVKTNIVTSIKLYPRKRKYRKI